VNYVILIIYDGLVVFLMDFSSLLTKPLAPYAIMLKD